MNQPDVVDPAGWQRDKRSVRAVEPELSVPGGFDLEPVRMDSHLLAVRLSDD